MDQSLTNDDLHEVVRISVAPFWMRPFCRSRHQYHINETRPKHLSVWAWGGISMHLRPLPVGYAVCLLVILIVALARLGTHLSLFFAAGLPVLTIAGAIDTWAQQRRLEVLVDNEELANQLVVEGCILSKWFGLNELHIHPQAPLEAMVAAIQVEADESGDRFQVAPFIRGVNRWPRLATDHPLLWQVGAVLVRLDEAVRVCDAKEHPEFGRNFHSQRLILDTLAFTAFLVIIHFVKGNILHLFLAVSLVFLLYVGVRLRLQSQRLTTLEPVLETALAGMESELRERTICWRVRLRRRQTFGDLPSLEWSCVPASKC